MLRAMLLLDCGDVKPNNFCKRRCAESGSVDRLSGWKEIGDGIICKCKTIREMTWHGPVATSLIGRSICRMGTKWFRSAIDIEQLRF
jgi:hypothetical protein